MSHSETHTSTLIQAEASTIVQTRKLDHSFISLMYVVYT